MKAIYFGLLAVTIAVCCAFTTKSVSGRDTVYYQFYTDSTGLITSFEGASSEDFYLTGCKFGEILCGKIYLEEDVVETFTGSGIYTVIIGHEGNQVYTYYKEPGAGE
jgi:hypothetical protein